MLFYRHRFSCEQLVALAAVVQQWSDRLRRMSDKNFVDVEVQGPRNPTLVRAFCRKCGKYQNVTLTGFPGRESVSCATCGILERLKEDGVGA